MITLTDIILIMLLNIVMYALFKLMKADITITIKQEFSESDRQLLEDIYNQDGDLKDKREEQMLEALDSAVRNINSILLDSEEGING